MSEALAPFLNYKIKDLVIHKKFGERAALNVINRQSNDTISDLAEDVRRTQGMNNSISPETAVRIIHAYMMANLMDIKWRQMGEECLKPGFVFTTFTGDLEFQIELKSPTN